MSFNDFFRKKGNYEILKLLKCKGRNYNSIKKEITSVFSARTLDFRLKELVELELIKNNVIEDVQLIRKRYSLTSKGIIVLTLFEMTEQLLKDEITSKSFQNLFSVNLSINRSLNFDYVWVLLKEILIDTEILYTLKQKKPNKILGMDDTGIIVQTERGENKIYIEMIEDAWYNLASEKSLGRSDHEKSTYRSSFMLALFSQLPFVEVERGPPLSIKFCKK